MLSEKVSNILNGIPCHLQTQQILQLGVHCSSCTYSLQKIIEISRTLYKSNGESCYNFLEYIEKHEINSNNYKNFTHHSWKIKIYYNLAALALTRAVRQNDKQNSQKFLKQFNKYFNLGANVKSTSQKMYQILHGFNSYYTGDFGKAISNFERIEKENKDKDNQANKDKNVNANNYHYIDFLKKLGKYKQNKKQKIFQLSTVALLGLAQCYFIQNNYVKALQYYKKALVSNKGLPTKARLGMAYTFYELEKYQLAQKCFQRILVLDQSCAEAYIGLAVLSYRNNNIEKYFVNLKQAYRFKSNDPLVLLHLSQHMFFTGNYQKCQKFCQKGLQTLQFFPKFITKQTNFRDDYQNYKARFNNLIGQIYHAKHQYLTAKKYYELAKQTGLKGNNVGLAQCLYRWGEFKQSLKILKTVFKSTNYNEVRTVAQYYIFFAHLQVKLQAKSTNELKDLNLVFKQAVKYNRNDYDTLIQYATYLGDNFDKKQKLRILQMALEARENFNQQLQAQLINNVGVSLIQDQKIRQAQNMLDKALNLLQNSQRITEEQKMKYHALYLIVHFNKAVALQLNQQPYEAIEIHKNIIKLNKYYIDSYVKLALLLFQIGQRQKSYELLDQAIPQFQKIKYEEMRLDKLITLKGHLKHIDNRSNQSRQIFHRMKKPLNAYEQLYQMCLQFQNLIQKQANNQIYKKFLDTNRKKIIKICESDHQNVFSYMVLTILFTLDHKITKQQSQQYFNQLRIAQIQFPIIQYNYGVYSLLSQDYESALFCFTRYKERTKNKKADQYIVLCYFLKEDYVKCIEILKIYMLEEPNNIKYRFQYAYAYEKRVQRLFEQQENIEEIKLSEQYLKISKKIFQSISKISSIDFLKTIDNADLKEKMKNQINKIRSQSQNRVLFVGTQITCYAQKRRQILQKQKLNKEYQARKIEQLRIARQQQFLLNQLQNDEDQSDSQIKRRQNRKKLQYMTLRVAQQAKQQMRLMQQRQKQQQQLNKNKKNKRQSIKKPRKIKQGQNKQQKIHSEQQFIDSQQQIKQNDEGVSNDKHKKKKKDKKSKLKSKKQDKKKKKKQRKDQSQSDVCEEQIQQNQNEDEDQDQDQDEEDNSISDLNQDQEDRQRQNPQKKQNKKKEDDDDEELDIRDFLIQ